MVGPMNRQRWLRKGQPTVTAYASRSQLVTRPSELRSQGALEVRLREGHEMLG